MLQINTPPTPHLLNVKLNRGETSHECLWKCDLRRDLKEFRLCFRQDVPEPRGPDRKERDQLKDPSQERTHLFVFLRSQSIKRKSGLATTFHSPAKTSSPPRCSTCHVLASSTNVLILSVVTGSVYAQNVGHHFPRMNTHRCVFLGLTSALPWTIQQHICRDFSCHELFNYCRVTWWHHPSGREPGLGVAAGVSLLYYTPVPTSVLSEN